MLRVPVLLAASILLSATAVASEPLKQIRGCMLQRMAVDRLLSYNDAKKACLDLLRDQGGLVASSGASKRALQPISSRAANKISN